MRATLGVLSIQVNSDPRPLVRDAISDIVNLSTLACLTTRLVDSSGNSMKINLTTLTCDVMRELDRVAIEDLGMPSLLLMENAGRGIADLVQESPACQRVLIACGHGNNGGDGLVVARHLDAQGVEVHVLLLAPAERLSVDALANYHWLRPTDVQIHIFDNSTGTPEVLQRSDFDWIIDALLGTGSRGTPRSPLDHLITQLNQMPGSKLAVDLPSGLDGDTGMAAHPTFRADVTATLVAAKPGLIANSADEYVGELRVLGIGLPRQLITDASARASRTV